jgi:tetratricopeptide (TPR) repeat protein
MLLDFNLAHNLNKTQAQAAATLGGTVAYMAPEHLRALSGRDPNLVRQVDQRSDIYSLGMVLYEMLTGRNAFDQSGSYSPVPVLMEAMAVERGRSVPSMRQQRTDVPWSLESIARKCLAPDQAQRYQQAEHLAEDLGRFLADEPLKYAPELSRLERMQKWVRRHPRLTSTGTVATTAVLLLVGAGVALAGVREHLAWTQEQLTVSQTQERRRAYEEGMVHALCWVNTTSQMRDHLALGLQACENTLALYDVLGRADWQNDVYWRRLEPDERLQLSEDTRELLLLLAWARVQKSPQDEDVLRDALKLLDRAEAIEGLRPSAALWWDRASYLRQLGEEEAAKAAADRALGTQPTNARDHYLLATTYLRNGGSDSHSKAVRELKESIRLNDKHYWSHMQKGICHLEMREFTLAASEFSQCVGLWPEFAWGHFNRGYALYQSGSKEEALLSYNEAIRRDPQFVNAYVNRGLVCLELKKYPQALADFQKAAQLGRDDASIHAGLGMAFEGVRQFSEADAAFEQAFRRTKTAPPSDRNRIRWTYAFAVASRLPQRAKEAFEEVLEQDPSHSQALYGLALVLVEQKEPEKALHLLDEAVKNAPHFIEARRGRAILRARRGHLEGAREDINWCLERDEKGGETLYKAACVLALAADKTVLERRALAEQAITFLQRAFVSGYGKEIAASDADLASIHGVPEFRRLLDEADKQGTNDQ